MSNGGDYERHQVESLLQSGQARLDRDVGLFLMPDDERSQRIHDAAVAPALWANGMNRTPIVRVFGSDSLVSEVCCWIQTARIIIVDLSSTNADLMYVMGLCHGLRRCPLILVPQGTELPFNLTALRCIEYDWSTEGMWKLRRQLTRTIRIWLKASG